MIKKIMIFLIISCASYQQAYGMGGTTSKLIFEDSSEKYSAIKTLNMITGDNREKVGIISITKCDLFEPFFKAVKNGEVKASDIGTLAPLVMLGELGYKYNESLILGDLYIYEKFRGKGYAQTLLKNCCKDLFEQPHIQCLTLIPNPFEYQDNKQVIVEQGYEEKRQQLIKFYSKHGFEQSAEVNHNILMYLSRNRFEQYQSNLPS